MRWSESGWAGTSRAMLFASCSLIMPSTAGGSLPGYVAIETAVATHGSVARSFACAARGSRTQGKITAERRSVRRKRHRAPTQSRSAVVDSRPREPGSAARPCAPQAAEQ